MNIDPSTTKYLIRAKIVADGVVEKPDVVGAIFGQTEGLLGDELDLRDLQKSGRMGRIEVEIDSKKGKSEGEIIMPSSLDQVETAILASALETIDRVGPCKAKIEVVGLEDVRVTKKAKIIERAKALLQGLMEDSKVSGASLTETVRQSVQVHEIISYGKEKCPAGPNIDTSDAIIIVEGRSDVLNLLKYGIKNAIAVEGTNVPQSIQELSKERIVTSFVDGDRGGELILRELLQTCEIDFIARAPRGREVEELTQKQVMKSLRNKVPAEQFIEMFGFNKEGGAQGQVQDTMSLFEGNEDDDDEGPRRDLDKRPQQPRPKFEKHDRPQQPQPPQTQIEKPIAPANHDAKPEVKEKRLNPDQQKYKRILTGLAGSFKAQLINSKGVTVKEIAVKELIDSLRSPPQDITAVVFDGVISQRLLDLAVENKIRTVVGVKCGSITKQPAAVEVLTKTDLE